jgi:hypothetical protein
MFVSHNHRTINISVPKTGSTSLHYALMSHLQTQCQMKDTAPSIYHISAEDIERIMGPEAFAAYFSCGVVRNPFDRMVSLWHDFHDQRGRIRAENFDDFILNGFLENWRNNIHFLPQAFFLCRGEVQMVSRIYRFEDGLESIMTDIGQRLGVAFSGIGHARKSTRVTWQSYLQNPRVVDLLAQHFAIDFELFGYDRTVGDG